jgi:tripartite-type tricarboxylate transporter receptor subunit TctC
MLNDLLGGQVDASMDAAATSWPHVQSGKLRALGISTAERAFFAPDLPPIRDVVPGFDVRPWHGVMAPAGTPQAIVDKLSAEIQAFLRQPNTEAKLRDRGVARIGSAARNSRKMADEYEPYRRIVKETGIKAD